MTAPAASAPAAPARSVTPRLGDTSRRSRFWIVLVLASAAVAVIILVATNSSRLQYSPLAADSPTPSGAKALVEVLRDHSVTVVNADSYDAAASSLRQSPSTLVVSDPHQWLDPSRLSALIDEAATAIVIGASNEVLHEIAPGVTNTTIDSDAATVGAECGLADAERAGRISASAHALEANGAYTVCFSTEADSGQLVAKGDLILLADGSFLNNEHIIAAGNAALAIGLTGEHSQLVWYLPTPADSQSGQFESVADLTPPWVTPVMVLLLVVGLAAVLWRGRRLGPLVPERLPVTVPARETMAGRARLYARTSARLRTLDALRIGTLSRMASYLDLSRTASTYDIIVSVSHLTGRHTRDLTALLTDDEPGSDSELVDAAEQLSRLEDDVHRLTVPGATPTTQNTKE